VSTRSLHPFIALASAAVLSFGLVGSAVAQEEASPEPSPGIEIDLESHEERKAERDAAKEERKAERAVAREERKTTRAEQRAERAAAREERKARRVSARELRKSARAEHRATWAEVKAACVAGLNDARTDEELDRAERREAVRAARAACKDLYLEARAEMRAEAAPIDELYTEAAADGTGVVRTDLGMAEPGSALGEELGLWHYLIPAGTELAAHTHPGWQLARVTDGELEYTVLEGEGILLRADGSQEPMGPGTYLLATGDGVIENPDLIHLGANRTAAPVTLISATLFGAGQPISTLVETEPAAAE